MGSIFPHEYLYPTYQNWQGRAPICHGSISVPDLTPSAAGFQLFLADERAIHLLGRQHDIQPLSQADMTIHLSGQPVAATVGETVSNVLNAMGLRRLVRSDHGQASGAFYGIGVCHCCLVTIDDRPKRRACQTVVRPGTWVETENNRFDREE